MSHKQWIILSITISISFAFAGPSHAADFVFRGPPAGVSPEISHFGNGQSWYGDVSPAGDDPSTSAIFGAQASAVPGDTHIIHFGDFEYLSGGSGPIAAADAVNSTAVVEIGSFVFDFDGFNVVGAQPGSYALTVFPGLTVGAPDTMTAATGLGKLVVRGDGTLTPRYLKVGSDSSTGELVVRGPNTVLQQPVFAGSDPDGVIGLFEVGESSGGSTGNKLTVELGATVDTAYTIRLSESEVLVDGAGSTVNAYSLWVNNSSKFTVSGGAALNSTSSDGPFYGLSNGSEIVFTGAGTTVDTQAQIYVKGGTLEISAGASVHSRKAFSGSGSSGILGGVDASFPGSTAVATVTGAGSSWTQDGAFNAGFSGDGTLNIQDGGLVSNTSGFIARLSGSTGAVTVDGAGSNWANSGGLFVGGDDLSAGGTGALTAQNSGLVNVASTLKIWNTGTVSLAGGTIDTAVIDHTDGGIFNFTSGTLQVGTFQGTLTQDGGTLVIGSSPGATDVTQDYTLNAGALEIELFGNGGSPVAGIDFDQLTADTANLRGTLDLVIDPGYTAALGDLFPIISTTSGVSGTFDTVSGADLGGGLRFGVSYDTFNVTLEVVFAGDGNGDGVVNGLDYLLWAAAFGSDPAADPPGSPGNGDYNDDKVVNGLDYLAWAGNFGAGSATAVPEPGACLLLFVGAVALLSRPCRRRAPPRS